MIDWLVRNAAQWAFGLLAFGAFLLLANLVLWLWHKARKGFEKVVAFYLVTEEASLGGWAGHGLTKSALGASLNVPEILQFLFRGPWHGQDASVEVRRLHQATKTSSVLVIPAGTRLTSKDQAVSFAVATARRDLPASVLHKAKAYAIESTQPEAGKAYAVVIGNVPGEAPRLVSAP